MELTTSFDHRSHQISRNTPLTDDEIARVAPSVFAATPSPDCTGRYSHLSTAAVLERLRDAGFRPFMACSSKARDEDRRVFTKHMLRLRHADQIAAARNEVDEIILVNSHDRSSSFQLLGGMMRFVCSNGIVTGECVGDVRLRHIQRDPSAVVQIAADMLQRFSRVHEHRESMRSCILTDEQATVLAERSLRIRYGTAHTPITAATALTVRRSEDSGMDLWSVFNRIQENLTKGGLDGRSKRGRKSHTRPVLAIDSNLRLNRKLWTLAEDAMTAGS